MSETAPKWTVIKSFAALRAAETESRRLNAESLKHALKLGELRAELSKLEARLPELRASVAEEEREMTLLRAQSQVVSDALWDAERRLNQEEKS